MKEIDWSKAPEGAEFWCDDNWFKSVDGEWFVWYPGAISWAKPAYKAPDNFSWWGNAVQRPSKAWTGTGLPPVGTVCEVEDEDGNWHECRILAHHMEDAVFIPDPGYPYGAYDGLPAGRFRPIRTPEQIAAEERERAIDDLCASIVSHYEAPKMSEHYLGLARALHDAGYRRQEPKE